MIIKGFSFQNELHYFVGLGSLIINNLELNNIFKLIDTIQNRFKDVMLQFFNKKLILNFNHIYYACYHALRNFHFKRNLSNKMGIEFLLFLAANRQIKRVLEYYGITIRQINQGTIDFCIISTTNNLEIIIKEILKIVNAKEIDLVLDNKSYTKYEIIKDYFNINENQIKTVLKSYTMFDNNIFDKPNIEYLYLAIEDLICEKMVFLSLEKSTYD